MACQRTRKWSVRLAHRRKHDERKVTYIRSALVHNEVVRQLFRQKSLRDSKETSVGVGADGQRHREHDERLSDDVEELEGREDRGGVQLVEEKQ